MATILENESAFSTTALTNSSVDTGINWAEGQDPGTVNNSARGMMAARAKARLDQGGSLAAGGTANALTVTTNQVLSAAHIAAGQRLLIRATAENTSATVTFAPDGLTAANIKRADGSALSIGSIKSGAYLDLVYNAGSSEWRCVNIRPLPASFLANKNGVPQASIAASTPTRITFGTAVFNNGSLYDTVNYRWTPPAGVVMISANLLYDGGIFDQDTVGILLYKNGSEYKDSWVAVSGNSPANGITAAVSVVDTANGTDYYEIFGYGLVLTHQVSGSTGYTWFSGTSLN